MFTVYSKELKRIILFMLFFSFALTALGFGSSAKAADDNITYLNPNHYYQLKIPGDWANKFKIIEEKNKTSFQFQSKTNLKADIVTIFATSSKTWEPDLFNQKKFIKADRNMVYYYVKPLDQPYSGQEAKDYEQMVNQIDFLINSFTITNPAEDHYSNSNLMFSIDLPKSWTDNYWVEETRDTVIFHYKSKGNAKGQIFKIAVVDKKDWAPDKFGQLKYITESNGKVYYYIKSLDNPFGKDYGKMVSEVSWIINSFSIDYTPNPKEYLEQYIAAAEMGDYKTVVDLYGGSYRHIQKKFPHIRKTDREALIRAYLMNHKSEKRLNAVLDQSRKSTFSLSISVLLQDNTGLVISNGKVFNYHLNKYGKAYKFRELPY